MEKISVTPHSYPMEIITTYLVQIFSAKTLKAIISWVVVGISFLFWEINLPVVACMILYIADMLLGMGKAIYQWKFCWIKLKNGIYKFWIYWGVIIVWHMLDLIFVHTTPDFWARYVIILYLGVTEWLSVLKHFAEMGWKAPQKLINRLEGVRDNLDSSWNNTLSVKPLIKSDHHEVA